MDYRKIIFFGNSSYVVSLPKKWVTKHDLKRGNLLGMEENGDGLQIYPKDVDKKPRHKPGEISVDGKSSERIETEIVSLYLTNCSTVDVYGDELGGKISLVKHVFRNLPGMEIMEENSKRIIFKDLMDAGELSVKTLIRRIDTLVRGMLEDAAGCRSKEQCASIAQRDYEVNRLCFLCHRAIRDLLAEKKNDNQVELLVDWQIATRLEEIGDDIKAAAVFLNKTGATGKLRERLLKAFQTTSSAYLKVMKAYYENDKTACHEIELETKRYIAEDMAILRLEHDSATARFIDSLNSINIAVKMISRQIINLE